MPFLYLGVQHFLKSWLCKIPLAECPETDESKSLVTTENLISTGCIIIILSIVFLLLMNSVFLTAPLLPYFSGLGGGREA